MTLPATDTAQMDEVFYNSFGTRPDAAIESWVMQSHGE